MDIYLLIKMPLKVILEKKIPDFLNGGERFQEFEDFSWDLLCFESSNTVPSSKGVSVT